MLRFGCATGGGGNVAGGSGMGWFRTLDFLAKWFRTKWFRTK